MKANDLLDMIGEAEDNIIAEAKKMRKVHMKRWGIVIAACFSLLIGSITTLAATGIGTRLIEFFTARDIGPDYKESGYNLSVGIEKISEADLSEEILSVGNTIKQQFEEYTPLDNWFPGEWKTDFESRRKACEYVGLKEINLLVGDWNEHATTVSVFGNEQGKILEIEIETDYSVEDIRMQFLTQIYTNNYNEEIIVGTRMTEDVDFSESYFNTDNDIQCHVIESSALESGYLSMDGYIVENGILYNLHIVYLEKESSQALELLYLWADTF